MSAPVETVQTRWESLPLAGDGRSVIVASAGTGKTYTIGMLYLRAVLEMQLQPRDILVTTYTRAAAAEISGRVRAVLESAYARAQGQPIAHEGVEAWLGDRWQAGAEPADDAVLLARALAGFDQAAIGTLHSICHGILIDHPFAVRAGFIAPALVDGRELHAGIARDIWRRMISPEDVSGLRDAYHAAGLTLTLEQFRTQFDALFKDGLVLDAPSPEDLDRRRLPAAWSAAQWDTFMARVVLHSGRTSTKGVQRLFAHAQANDGDLSTISLDANVESLADKPLITNKGSKATEAELEAFEAYIRPWVKWMIARAHAPVTDFWQKVLDTATHLRDREMASAQLLTFDAVMLRVRDALAREAEGGSASRPLADALFAAWPVAMVDEFQDTDGIQFEILDGIYSEASGAPRGRLVMIGDPKQSIYRFRGADVNVFTGATGKAGPDDRLTLGRNFRSSKPYVEALNFLYRETQPVLGAGIQYEAVAASDRCDDEPMVVDAAPAVPLTFWIEASETDADPLALCAEQIAGLLSDTGAKIGHRRLRPEDFAVLLTSNADVYAMVKALRAHGVPAVSKSTRSVFTSETAHELEVLLHAVLHAGDPAIRRAAAATGLWGTPFETVRAWVAQEGLDHGMAETLAEWHAAWAQNGPLHVLGRIIAHTAPTQLKAQSGERVLTDLRHLGELMQANTHAGDSLESQLAWLVRQIEESDAAGDEDSLEARNMRMESDEKRVQVMTLHASKGLEFPIVFLPTAAKLPKPLSAPYVYTAPDGVRLVSPFDDAKEPCKAEDADERQRLLYVALTRAIHACHVYVRHKANGTPVSGMVHTHRETLASDAARVHGVLLMPHWPESKGAVHFSGAEAGGTQRAARVMPPPQNSLPEHHSFSTLTRGSKHSNRHEPAPADDERDLASELTRVAVAPDSAIASLEGVKGTEIGNALHTILEHRDFSMPLTAQPDHVSAHLRAGAFLPAQDTPTLVQSVAAMLDRALAADLQLQQAPGFKLADLAPDNARAELEFNFEISTFNLSALRTVLSEYGLKDILPAQSFSVRGFLNGKIDLVFETGGRFHVLDYKSNALGTTDADFSGEALVAAMDKSHYRFQALIYAVALDRYLASRIPEYRRARHLGEAVYLFLRAARPGSTAGIWSYRFDDGLIDAVQGLLKGEHATHGHGHAA